MLKVAYHPIYSLELPIGHRFPMIKYELIPEQLVHEGTLNAGNFFQPDELEEEIILWTHENKYWESLKNLSITASEVRRIGFPLTQTLIKRETTIAKGSVMAANFALQHGVAMNIAGGTHHAFTNRGEGFCLLNDQAIAANYLLANNKARRILIIDLDVHQGNGTAQIFNEDERVFTFSMHGASNFPYRKEKSDLDIALPDGTTDEEYLTILYKTLPYLISLHQPDFICYLSGVDVLETDKLGKLALSKEACKLRDKEVLKLCKSANIPVLISMGGGYSPDIKDIVEAHCNTFRIANDLYF